MAVRWLRDGRRGPLHGQLSSVLVHSTCSALLRKDIFGDPWQPGKQQSLVERLASQSHRDYKERSPCPWSRVVPSGPRVVPDWSILMQMRAPNPHSLIAPESTVLIGQDGHALFGQWRFW